jgi:hypothetical protein
VNRAKEYVECHPGASSSEMKAVIRLFKLKEDGLSRYREIE